MQNMNYNDKNNTHKQTPSLGKKSKVQRKKCTRTEVERYDRVTLLLYMLS